MGKNNPPELRKPVTIVRILSLLAFRKHQLIIESTPIRAMEYCYMYKRYIQRRYNIFELLLKNEVSQYRRGTIGMIE